MHPERDVVCFAGDGCFLMTGQELATAVQYGLGVVTLILDNGMYGTIRMHQERELSGQRLRDRSRQSGFRGASRRPTARMARRCGDGGFRAGLRSRARCGGPAIVHILMEKEIISTRSTLTEIRAKAKAPQD